MTTTLHFSAITIVINRKFEGKNIKMVENVVSESNRVRMSLDAEHFFIQPPPQLSFLTSHPKAVEPGLFHGNLHFALQFRWYPLDSGWILWTGILTHVHKHRYIYIFSKYDICIYTICIYETERERERERKIYICIY